MWATIGFIVAAVIGLVTVLSMTRPDAIRRDDYPWVLDEVSKLHVQIVGGLAGFAFTGVVLVVTLVRDRPGSSDVALVTVIVMFLVAYLFWVGAAFLISFIPYDRTSGDFVQREHFSLATTIEYRTVFLSWFALLPLLQANGLGRLAPIVDVLLLASLLLGSLLLAMVTDGLGLMTFKEIYLSAAVGAVLAIGYAALVAFAFPSARSSGSALNLAVVIFWVNTLGFAFAALTPLAPRYPSVRRFYERLGRRIVVADMQLTMASLCFLWFAVAGVI